MCWRHVRGAVLGWVKAVGPSSSDSTSAQSLQVCGHTEAR